MELLERSSLITTCTPGANMEEAKGLVVESVNLTFLRGPVRLYQTEDTIRQGGIEGHEHKWTGLLVQFPVEGVLGIIWSIPGHLIGILHISI